MSLFEYLQLQPIEPQEDGTVSELDMYEQDETFDLSHDEDGESLLRKFEQMSDDFHDVE